MARYQLIEELERQAMDSELQEFEEKNKESWIARNTRRIKRKLGIKKL